MSNIITAPADLNDVLQAFYAGTDESLDQLEQDILRLEMLDDDEISATAGEIFTQLHQLGGSAGFLGLEKMAVLAGAAEHAVERIRTGDEDVTSEIIDLLLQAVETLKALLVAHKNQEDDNTIDSAELAMQLEGTDDEEPASVIETAVVETVVEIKAEVETMPEKIIEAVQAAEPLPAPVVQPIVAPENTVTGPLLARENGTDKRSRHDRRKSDRRGVAAAQIEDHFEALFVQVGGVGFAIPLTEIGEVQLLKANDIRTEKNRNFIDLKGEILPLLELSRTRDKTIDAYVVVAQGCGLVIDEFPAHGSVYLEPGAGPGNGAVGGAVVAVDGSIYALLNIAALVGTLTTPKAA